MPGFVTDKNNWNDHLLKEENYTWDYSWLEQERHGQAEPTVLDTSSEMSRRHVRKHVQPGVPGETGVETDTKSHSETRGWMKSSESDEESGAVHESAPLSDVRNRKVDPAMAREEQ